MENDQESSYLIHHLEDYQDLAEGSTAPSPSPSGCGSPQD